MANGNARGKRHSLSLHSFDIVDACAHTQNALAKGINRLTTRKTNGLQLVMRAHTQLSGLWTVANMAERNANKHTDDE